MSTATTIPGPKKSRQLLFTQDELSREQLLCFLNVMTKFKTPETPTIIELSFSKTLSDHLQLPMGKIDVHKMITRCIDKKYIRKDSGNRYSIANSGIAMCVDHHQRGNGSDHDIPYHFLRNLITGQSAIASSEPSKGAPITLDELVENTGLSRTTINNACDDLCTMGLIERVPISNDRHDNSNYGYMRVNSFHTSANAYGLAYYGIKPPGPKPSILNTFNHDLVHALLGKHQMTCTELQATSFICRSRLEKMILEDDKIGIQDDAKLALIES